MRYSRGLWLWLAGWMAVGCATTDPPRRLRLSGDPIADAREQIAHGRPEDRVLWQYRGAMAALQRGQLGTAREFLQAAVERIMHIYGPDPSAKRARSFFEKESRKTYIGEPYERAMAFYYRALLYWRDGQLDNARACYRSAALHDSDLQDGKYMSDFVLFDYLEGLINVKLGQDGRDAFKRASAHARLSAPPPYDPAARVLFFVDFGQGPLKVAGGRYGERLLYRERPSSAQSVQIRVAGKALRLRPFDDLFFQATSRGGRVMDEILESKAQFKEATDTLGTVGLVSGTVLATDRHTREAGLGLIAAGLLSKILSGATRPEADTRTWDNLPRYLNFAAVALPPGQYSATVDFLDDRDRILRGLTKTVQFEVPAGQHDVVLYVNDQSKTPLSL